MTDEHGTLLPGIAGDAETSWERRDRMNKEAREIVRRPSGG